MRSLPVAEVILQPKSNSRFDSEMPNNLNVSNAKVLGGLMPTR